MESAYPISSVTNKNTQDDPDHERIFFFDEELVSKRDAIETPNKYLKQPTRLEKKLQATCRREEAKL